MRPQEIYSLALSCGFVAKEQPDGTMDLNPYVYDFANAVISADHLGGCGPAVINTLIRNRDSAEKKAAQYAAEAESLKEKNAALAKDNTSMLGLLADLREALGDNGERMQPELVAYASELHDTVQSLRAVLKEHGVQNAPDYQPNELPPLVSYKLRHAKKYVESARAENHQLKNSISSNAVLFANDVIIEAFAGESVKSDSIKSRSNYYGLTITQTVTEPCTKSAFDCACDTVGFPTECISMTDEFKAMTSRVSDKKESKS